MFTVKETPYFQREAANVWSDSERDEFIDWIADNPLAGDVIPRVLGRCVKCAGRVKAWVKAAALG